MIRHTLQIDKTASYDETGEADGGRIEYLIANKADDGVYVKRDHYVLTVRTLNNDLVRVECFLNGSLHNNTGPARFNLSYSGEMYPEYYLSNGQCDGEADWRKRRDAEADEPFELMLEEILAEMQW